MLMAEVHDAKRKTSNFEVFWSAQSSASDTLGHRALDVSRCGVRHMGDAISTALNVRDDFGKIAPDSGFGRIRC